MSDEFIVETFNLDEIGDEVASEDVAKAGMRKPPLPAGNYKMSVSKMEGRTLPDNAKTDPGRRFVNLTFEEPDSKRRVYCDISWVPSTEENDKMAYLYSQVELALGMTGEKIIDVLTTAADSEFTVNVIETCRIKVEDLPEDNQAYYLNTKGLGASTEVTVYLKPEEVELREHLLLGNHRIRNYVKAINPVVE